VVRTCASCGRQFEAQRSTARYCGSTCRSRAHRAPVVSVGQANPLREAVRQELEAAGRLETVLGQQALMLADRLAAQGDTGSAVAALSRELRAVMEAALADAPAAADALDELAERRRRKAAGA